VNGWLLIAMNRPDLDAFVACIADGYRSEQPAHRDRVFTGASQVRDNWAGVFAGVPDFTAELLTSAVTEDDVDIGERRWHRTHTDGKPFEMRGTTVLGIAGDKISWVVSTWNRSSATEPTSTRLSRRPIALRRAP
jgi:hypothetical protein